MTEQKRELKNEIIKMLIIGFILATIVEFFKLIEFFLIQTIGSPFGFYGEMFVRTIFVASLTGLCFFLIGNYGKIFDIKNDGFKEKLITRGIKILIFMALLIMLVAYYLSLRYS